MTHFTLLFFSGVYFTLQYSSVWTTATFQISEARVASGCLIEKQRVSGSGMWGVAVICVIQNLPSAWTSLLPSNLWTNLSTTRLVTLVVISSQKRKNWRIPSPTGYTLRKQKRKAEFPGVSSLYVYLHWTDPPGEQGTMCRLLNNWYGLLMYWMFGWHILPNFVSTSTKQVFLSHFTEEENQDMRD